MHTVCCSVFTYETRDEKNYFLRLQLPDTYSNMAVDILTVEVLDLHSKINAACPCMKSNATVCVCHTYPSPTTIQFLFKGAGIAQYIGARDWVRC